MIGTSREMHHIIGASGTGKTGAAIDLAAEKQLYIVVLNREEATRVFRLARANGKDIPFPITFDELIDGRFQGKGINGFIVDNADELLRKLGRGVPVVAATWFA